jgi:hypothetical protein
VINGVLPSRQEYRERVECRAKDAHAATGEDLGMTKDDKSAPQP